KIRRYEEIPATHARFRKFQNIVLDKVYEYLFIPPSKPDYKLWGIYENADYSKSLVFSHNYHTPRAFSAMLSYESERRNLEGEYRNPESKCLNLENPKDCEDIASAQNGYEDRTRYDLSGKKYSKETEKIEEECIQAEIDRYRDLMKSMEAGFKEEESPYKRAVEKARAGYENLEKDDLFCLGSMAGYFLELAKEFAWKETLFDEYLKKYLLALYSVFTTKEAYGILCKVGNEDDSYMEKIYKYNAQGNIHAVLDEYFHLILEEEHLTFESFQDNSNENFKELEKKYFSIIKYYMNSHRFRVKVNTTDGASINIYTNFAQGITGDEAKVDTQKALKHKMVCFNSPFRPFVFTTTSVGAEGLDFHWYCSNIYHWALEMNPEKFQQKEGRINRFHCHGVRRNLGRDLPDKSWAEIYLATSKKEGDPFWPEWVYEGNGKNGPYAELKRHTMYYPGSFEDESYSDMIQNMKLYRAVVDGNYLCPLNRIQTKK
ncbi:MAG: hypothetical protein IJD31_09470, partial [Lachnospiraceae bacterium]|nr:hypothetical protein [Lachnospiraceae bacterium]